MDWSLVVAVLVYVALGGFGTATLAYWILAPWHRTRMGRNFMFMLLTVTFTLALVAFSKVIPIELRIFFGVLIYGLFAIAGVAFAVNIIREQLHSKKNTSIDKVN